MSKDRNSFHWGVTERQLRNKFVWKCWLENKIYHRSIGLIDLTYFQVHRNNIDYIWLRSKSKEYSPTKGTSYSYFILQLDIQIYWVSARRKSNEIDKVKTHMAVSSGRLYFLPLLLRVRQVYIHYRHPNLHKKKLLLLTILILFYVEGMHQKC